MNVRVHLLGLALLLLLAVAALAPRGALAASEFSLIDQGWQIVEEDGKRSIEVSAMVVNQSQAPLKYEVRFVVERADDALRAAAPAANTSGEEQPVWSVVQATSVRGGPVAPGTHEIAKATFPHGVLEPGKAHRFRSELSEAEGSADAPTGPIMADAVLTSLGSPFAPTATLGGFRLPPMSLPTTDGTRLPHPSPRDAIGSPTPVAAAATVGFGTISGPHWSLHDGTSWLEYGKGLITVKGHGWTMAGEYYYKATGEDAERLTATFLPVGSWAEYHGPEGWYDVRFGPTTVTMEKAGARHEVGDVVYRYGARAAGTFEATMTKQAGPPGDGQPVIVWSGTLSLYNGKMSLDFSRLMMTPNGLPLFEGHPGHHDFKFKYTATQVSP